LLSKLSGQDDIIVGTPTAGRRHADLENIIGMFVNTLAMRNYPEGGKTIEEYLGEVKENTLQAFENQEYQFEELVEKLSVRRDTARNPIFDVMFNLLNQSTPSSTSSRSGTPPATTFAKESGSDANGTQYRNAPGGATTSKFDLTLSGFNVGDSLFFDFEYCTKLFKKKTIERFVTYFARIMQTISKAPHQKIGKIEIITEDERKQILYDFNDTTADYPRNKTIHRLFEEQMERTPDKISIIGKVKPVGNRGEENYKLQAKTKNEKEIKKQIGAPGVGGIHKSPLQHTVQLTYRELNEKSNLLARHLKNKGVQPGTIVAIKIGRTAEMISAIMAVLKAGGAYLPIDPDYPEKRIKYMLKHSNTKIILKEFGEFNELNDVKDLKESKELGERGEFGEGIEIIDIHFIHKSSANVETQPPAPGINHPASGLLAPASSLAYVIYTSGSTGKPKGVMIEHASLLNFIKAMTDIIEFKPDDCILSLTTICFDIFGLETLLPLTTGTKIIIGSSREQREPYAAGQLMEQERVSIFQSTPSRLQLLLSDEKSRAGLARLNALLLGGEALPLIILEEVRAINPGKIYNVYGPTETTIWSTAKEVTGQKALNIGKPIANTQIYILDRWDIQQPMGIAGELCIGGDGLARGYINS
ncbi:MAG: AMP-binding protein, partial [bacterium]|nr:AMP-binding protein [bacterium]